LKSKKNYSGIVYSTNPDFKLNHESHDESLSCTPDNQKIRIRLETKHRAGKAATIIDGFIGTEIEREDIVKKLKSFCGTGGSSKDGEMMIQGDQRDKVLSWLQKNGFKQSKRI